MSKWTNLASRIALKAVIIFSAMLITAVVSGVFHLQTTGTFAGITFLISTVGLFLVFERILFPKVYGKPTWKVGAARSRGIFCSGGDIAVEVRDVAAARRWYSDHLGFTYSSAEIEDSGTPVGYSRDHTVIYLLDASEREPRKSAGRPPIMFARKLTVAHEFLSSTGVFPDSIQTDSGGNRFFRFRDLDGNILEVCQDQ